MDTAKCIVFATGKQDIEGTNVPEIDDTQTPINRLNLVSISGGNQSIVGTVDKTAVSAKLGIDGKLKNVLMDTGAPLYLISSRVGKVAKPYPMIVRTVGEEFVLTIDGLVEHQERIGKDIVEQNFVT